jgi:3-oxoacyl-[acyl-carrier protein] reductase
MTIAQAAWIVGVGGIGAAVRDRLTGDYRTVVFDRANVHSPAESHYRVDVTERRALIEAAQDATIRFGPPAVVVLAFGRVSSATVETAEPDEVDQVIGDNLVGCVNVLHTIHRSPRAASCICLIVTSNAALVARPHQPLYAATKAAVASLVRSLAPAWGTDGIRLVGVAPGTVTVNRNQSRVQRQYPDAPADPGRPGGRLVTPVELADFLARLIPYADQLTGQVLAFDGGSTLGAGR